MAMWAGIGFLAVTFGFLLAMFGRIGISTPDSVVPKPIDWTCYLVGLLLMPLGLVLMLVVGVKEWML